jgi:hypothetical protein
MHNVESGNNNKKENKLKELYEKYNRTTYNVIYILLLVVCIMLITGIFISSFLVKLKYETLNCTIVNSTIVAKEVTIIIYSDPPTTRKYIEFRIQLLLDQKDKNITNFKVHFTEYNKLKYPYNVDDNIQCYHYTDRMSYIYIKKRNKNNLYVILLLVICVISILLFILLCIYKTYKNAEICQPEQILV